MHMENMLEDVFLKYIKDIDINYIIMQSRLASLINDNDNKPEKERKTPEEMEERLSLIEEGFIKSLTSDEKSYNILVKFNHINRWPLQFHTSLKQY